MNGVSDADVIKIADWLAGACSPSESREIEQRVAEESELRALVAWLRETRTAGVYADPARDARIADQVRRRVDALGVGGEAIYNGRIGSESGTGSGRGFGTATRERGIVGTQFLRAESAGSGSRTLRRLGWSIGVAFAVILTIVFVRIDRSSGTETTGFYTTHAGQQATLTLVDGTRVTLAPRSTLRLVRFGEQSRTLVLEGEAYFEVTQSSSVPFVVRAGGVSTRVLGTNFMIRHSPGTRNVRVAVADGKVLVTSQTSRWTDVPLVKGTIGDFGDSTVQVGTVNDVAPGAEWRDGKLIFRHTSVATILQALGRWYGYHFQCPDAALLRQDVTIALSMRSSSAALAALEEILSVNLNVAGDTIILTPHPPRRTKAMPRIQSYDVWIPPKEAGR